MKKLSGGENTKEKVPHRINHLYVNCWIINADKSEGEQISFSQNPNF